MKGPLSVQIENCAVLIPLRAADMVGKSKRWSLNLVSFSHFRESMTSGALRGSWPTVSVYLSTHKPEAFVHVPSRMSVRDGVVRALARGLQGFREARMGSAGEMDFEFDEPWWMNLQFQRLFGDDLETLDISLRQNENDSGARADVSLMLEASGAPSARLLSVTARLGPPSEFLIEVSESWQGSSLLPDYVLASSVFTRSGADEFFLLAFLRQEGLDRVMKWLEEAIASVEGR